MPQAQHHAGSLAFQLNFFCPGPPLSHVGPPGGFWLVTMTPITATGMKRPNPLPPDRMTAAERRTELCRILALGLIRLRSRDTVQQSETAGESSLHFPPEQSVGPDANRRRTA